MNCFLSTPVSILPCKASLPPLDSLLPHKRKMAGFRMGGSSPLINLAATRLPSDIPSHSPSRAADSLRHLVKGLRQNYILLRWNQDRPVPAVRSHLAIDSLCHTLRSVVAVAKTLPLLHPYLLSIGERPSQDPPLGRSYQAQKSLLKGHLLQNRLLQSPPPLSYHYPPMLILPPFIGLDWFTAGRIYQMHSEKSYMAAHTNWGNLNPTKTGPSCVQEDVTFAYAILACPTKARQRARYPLGGSSIGPESPLCTDKTSIVGLASYIWATYTGHPPLLFD